MICRIVITGITNMSIGHICISGYEMSDRKYIRPIIPGSHILESFLSSHKSPIELGSTIELDLSFSNTLAQPPHIEDNPFDPPTVKVLESMTRDQFCNFIASIAEDSVESIFGYEIELINGQPILPEGTGARSLGAIIGRKCSVYCDHMGKARCDFVDQSGCEYRHLPIVGRDEWVKKPGNYLDIPIRLSLTRLFQKDDDSEPVYWMQVSGVIAKNDC